MILSVLARKVPAWLNMARERQKEAKKFRPKWAEKEIDIRCHLLTHNTEKGVLGVHL